MWVLSRQRSWAQAAVPWPPAACYSAASYLGLSTGLPVTVLVCCVVSVGAHAGASVVPQNGCCLRAQQHSREMKGTGSMKVQMKFSNVERMRTHAGRGPLACSLLPPGAVRARLAQGPLRVDALALGHRRALALARAVLAGLRHRPARVHALGLGVLVGALQRRAHKLLGRRPAAGRHLRAGEQQLPQLSGRLLTGLPRPGWPFPAPGAAVCVRLLINAQGNQTPLRARKTQS